MSKYILRIILNFLLEFFMRIRENFTVSVNETLIGSILKLKCTPEYWYVISQA